MARIVTSEMQAFAPQAVQHQERPRRSTMDNLSRQLSVAGQLGGMVEALADSKVVGMASQVFGDASLTPEEEAGQKALKTAQGTFDAKKVAEAAQAEAKVRASQRDRDQQLQYREQLQRGRGPGEQAVQLERDIGEAHRLYLDQPDDPSAPRSPLVGRMQQLAAERSRVGVDLERQGGADYRAGQQRLAQPELQSQLDALDKAADYRAPSMPAKTPATVEIERKVRAADDAKLGRLLKAAEQAGNQEYVAIVQAEQGRRGGAGDAGAVDRLRGQMARSIKTGDRAMERDAESKMEQLARTGKTTWEPADRGQKAVSGATQATAEQARVRGEELRAKVTGEDRKALEDGLMAAGTVSDEMRDNATRMLEAEKRKVDQENEQFLRQTARMVKSAEPEFELDADGRPIGVKTVQKPTVQQIAGLARMADTPEKQQRVMEIAGNYELPYRTLSERFDPGRQVKFARELEQLFPAARKSPVEIALNNAMLATKITGLGVAAEQKQETLVQKLHKLGIDSSKLQHALDQDQFKNASQMDKIRILEMMGLSRIESQELLGRLGIGLRRQELGQRREEKQQERVEKATEKADKKAAEAAKDAEKAEADLEEAKREAARLGASTPLQPAPAKVMQARRTPSDPDSDRVIKRDNEYRDHVARKGEAEQKARDLQRKAEDARRRANEAASDVKAPKAGDGRKPTVDDLFAK